MPAPHRPSRPRIVATRKLPPKVEARMAELFDVVLNPDDHPLDAAALAAAAADADVLVPTLSDAITARVIAAGEGRLRLIANFGNGVDHIDLAAARVAGIPVTNTPGVLTEDTADMAMALLLAVPRRLAEGAGLLRAGGWRGWSPTGLLGHRVNGGTLGILGMGRIGQAVARRARGFGIAIHYHNRRRLPAAVEAEHGAIWHPELDDMLRAVDLLSIHCPHTRETHRLVDRRRLALLGPQGYLINVARGEIVDGAALVEALEAGEVAGAGLDVFAAESSVAPRLAAIERVVLLPHMASATHEARDATGARVIANIRAWADGHRPPDQVLEGWA